MHLIGEYKPLMYLRSQLLEDEAFLKVWKREEMKKMFCIASYSRD